MKAAKIQLIAPFLFFFIIFGYASALASEYEGGKVTLIKKATTAANGQRLAYAKTETPEVTAALVEIPPGGDTGWHSHPIPAYAYVVSGAITETWKAVGSATSRRVRSLSRSSTHRTSSETRGTPR